MLKKNPETQNWKRLKEFRWGKSDPEDAISKGNAVIYQEANSHAEKRHMLPITP